MFGNWKKHCVGNFVCWLFSFSVNASQAGAGNLEIIVSVNGRNVPNYVQSEGNAKFRVNFKPQEAAPHSLSVRFNGEPVPGSPFTCKVMGSNQIVVSGPALKMTPVGQPTCLIIDPQVWNVYFCFYPFNFSEKLIRKFFFKERRSKCSVSSFHPISEWKDYTRHINQKWRKV